MHGGRGPLVALVVVMALSACGDHPTRLAQLRMMSDEEVAAYLRDNPRTVEAEYVGFILSPQAGLGPPTGVSQRNLLIFAYEECAGLAPSPPAEWLRERVGEPVGFENFAHTARGFAHRMICPSE